jgi:hypothetical protein
MKWVENKGGSATCQGDSQCPDFSEKDQELQQR